MEKLKKTESITVMERLGMNTLNYFITEDEKEVTHYIAKHMDDKLSLRTERGDEYRCPYYYMVIGRELLLKALPHLREGYKAILAPSLDTTGCQVFGAIAFTERGEPDIFEFVIGEGKVRELDTHPDRKTVFLPHESGRNIKDAGGFEGKLMEMHEYLSEVCYSYVPCIVEFSIYNRPVGRLGKPEIYWEIRPYE